MWSPEYCTCTHDSLKISHGKWYWSNRGIGGRMALDYLIKVRGLEFVSVVQVLCGYNPPPQAARPALRPTTLFRFPAASRYPSAVVFYLQDLAIDPEIIYACLEAGILYESRRYQNCVFVRRDPSGQPRSAALRGTKDGFKRDVKGRDKQYACLPVADSACPRLAVAESPIDALSLATLEKRSGGLWRSCHYLSLGGTALRVLLQFLKDHPNVTQVSLFLDNGRAGMDGMDRLERAIREDAVLAAQVTLLCRNPPPGEYGKDYNDFLTALIRLARSQSYRREEVR